jgi:hypothetical protein
MQVKSWSGGVACMGAPDNARSIERTIGPKNVAPVVWRNGVRYMVLPSGKLRIVK